MIDAIKTIAFKWSPAVNTKSGFLKMKYFANGNSIDDTLWLLSVEILNKFDSGSLFPSFTAP